jgi:hypothetical protein
MNAKQLFLLIAVSSMFPIFRVSADPPVSFDILTTIDYPGADYTFASGINDRGDVTGDTNYNNVFQRGYVLFANGDWSPLIVNPDANYGVVYSTGINNARTICGSYPASDGSHGFLYSDGTFTDVVVHSSRTVLSKVNDAGNFCGYTVLPDEGFVSIDGVVTVFAVPGASATYAYGINNLNQVTGLATPTAFAATPTARLPIQSTWRAAELSICMRSTTMG